MRCPHCGRSFVVEQPPRPLTPFRQQLLRFADGTRTAAEIEKLVDGGYRAETILATVRIMRRQGHPVELKMRSMTYPARPWAAKLQIYVDYCRGETQVEIGRRLGVGKARVGGIIAQVSRCIRIEKAQREGEGLWWDNDDY